MKRLAFIAAFASVAAFGQPIDPNRPSFISATVKQTLRAGTVDAGVLIISGGTPPQASGLGSPGGGLICGSYNTTYAACWSDQTATQGLTNFVFQTDGNNTRVGGASEALLYVPGPGELLVATSTPGHGSVHQGGAYGSTSVELGVYTSEWGGFFAWSSFSTPNTPICSWTTGFNTAATTFTAANCPAPSGPTGSATNVLAVGTRDYIQYAGAAAGNAVAGLNGGPFTMVQPYMRPKVVANIRTDSAITNRRIWSGLFESTPATLAVAAGPSASAIDFVGFGYEAGVLGGDWACCAGDGTNYSCADTGVVVAVSTEYTLSVDWRTSGTIHCCVDSARGVYTGTPPTCVDKTTNLSTNATGLGIYVANTTTNSAAQNMQISSAFLQ